MNWGDLSTTKLWQAGQIFTANLPNRGINGDFLIQKVTLSPQTDVLWTYNVEYGGRLLGIADFLKSLVSAQQQKQTTQNALLHKFSFGQETTTLTDDMSSTAGLLQYVCGDPNAICGFVECN